MTPELSSKLAIAFEVRRFDRSACTAKDEAQRNLAGRTPYANDATLRFFNARILSTQIAHKGTVFGLVESVAADWDNTKRHFQFVVFDLTGRVINDHDATRFKTADKAREALNDWLTAFDAVAHYSLRTQELAARLERQTAALRAVYDWMRAVYD